MKIHVSAGLGTGPTKLAAFDSALLRAGVANFNLIRLSSVIPPHSIVDVPDSAEPVKGQWGDRLYLVYAEMRADKPGDQAWAGIGWVQDKTTGLGLFVEHEGHSEAGVRQDIQNSLTAMVPTRDGEFGPIQMKVAGLTCKDEPVCALVVAAYQSAPWA